MANESICQHFPTCSGCCAIGVPYEEQVARKLGEMRERFAHAELPGLDPASMVKITPSPSALGYRNRAKLVPGDTRREQSPTRSSNAASRRRSRESVRPDAPHSSIKLGLFRAGTHDVVDISDCPVQTAGLNNTLAVLRNELAKPDVSLYDEIAHRGDVRFVTVRESQATGEQLVGFMTRAAEWRAGPRLAEVVLQRCAPVVGVVQHVNPRKGNAMFANPSNNRLLAGRAHIEEQVCGVTVRLGLTSFFQINTPVAERAYEAMIRALSPSVTTTVLDLYCGVGAIAMVAAKRAGRVVGIEEVGESVTLARSAAIANDIENTEWYEGKVEEVLPELAPSIGKLSASPDELVVALNPPRKGIGDSVVDAIVSLTPARVAYLSCSPTSLLRDLARFCWHGYSIDHVELFDMFPQTDQVETLALLTQPSKPV